MTLELVQHVGAFVVSISLLLWAGFTLWEYFDRE